MKKVDFRKIQCEMVDGSILEVDMSKEIANMIYRQTKDCGEAMFAQELYKNGEVELDEEKTNMVKKVTKDFVFFAANAIEKALS